MVSLAIRSCPSSSGGQPREKAIAYIILGTSRFFWPTIYLKVSHAWYRAEHYLAMQNNSLPVVVFNSPTVISLHSRFSLAPIAPSLRIIFSHCSWSPVSPAHPCWTSQLPEFPSLLSCCLWSSNSTSLRLPSPTSSFLLWLLQVLQVKHRNLKKLY